jgi:outer membrane protein assembly complex protein YaeT
MRLLPLVVTLSSAIAWAQAGGNFNSLEGRRIVDVKYEPAGVLDPEDLAKAQPIQIGDPLRAENVAEAIDRLFATGEFDDIRAEAQISGDGLILRFVTTPVRYIGAVTIQGKVVDPPNRGELTSLPQLARGDEFHEQDLQDAVDRMRRLLVANGFYDATVEPMTKTDEHRQVFLTFDVRHGKRAKYEMPIVNGDIKLPIDTIVSATGWRVRFIHWWRQVTQARTRNAATNVAAKYESKDRLKADVRVNKLDYDAATRRVQPTLTVVPGPVVKINAIGAKVSRRVMKRYVPVFQEHAVDNDLLAEGARNLRDYLQSKGYYDATVDFRTSNPDEDNESVEYAISLGSQFKLVHIEITGNKYFDEETLRERMFIEPATFYLRRGRFSRAFLKKDEENLTNLYHGNGFRDVKITSDILENYKGQPGKVAVAVRIEEGPLWVVDGVTLEGVSDADRKVIEPQLSSSNGQPFSEVSLAADRNLALTYYASQGYPNADFKAAWAPAAMPNRVAVVYTASPGERQFVREILTSGLTHTRSKLIEERMTLHAGDPISVVTQRAIQRSLYDMGVFARVDTAIENSDGATNHKYVLYAFDEANRYTVTVGAGAQVGRFGTPSTTANLNTAGGETGFSPLFSLTVNRLNFLGLGHTVSLRGVYSNLQKRASLSYYAPRFMNKEGRSITYSLLYDQTLDVRTFASKRQEVSVQVAQKFSRSTTGFLRFAYRNVGVSDVVIPVLLIPQFLQSVRIGMLSFNLVQDLRDNPVDPHRGRYNTADFGLSTKYFGSDRSFTRVLLRNATYYRLSKNVVVARQTQFGVISPFSVPAGFNEAQSVPLPERFFGGGEDSLRAFPYNQAGPRDIGAPLIPGGPSSRPTGFPLGGNALFFNTVEVRLPLIGENIRAAIFHDMGNIYTSLSDISFRAHQRDLTDFDYGVHAVGAGLRYKTPIGPVRADFAYSINPPAYLGFSGTPADLLNCGTTANPICQSTRQSVSHFQFFFSIGQTF